MSNRMTNGAHQLGRQALHTDDTIINEGSKQILSYPDILTLAQTCEILQIGQSTARNLFRTGQLPGIKIGGLWRIPKAHLLSFIAGGGQQ